MVNEEVITEGAYEKAEENKRSADAAKKQGDMFAHHLHMADHHDNMAEWHGSKGRHGEADKHAEKAEKHHEEAMKLKEETSIKEGYVVRYHNPKSEKHGSEKHFDNQASAQKHADRGNSVDKIGGKYTVHKTNEKGHAMKEEVELDESVKIVDRDSDLDQEHFKLHVNGKPVHFVHHNYENSHASDSKDDIHYQVKKQLKHLSPQHQKAVTNAVHASYRIKEEVEQIDELSKSTIGSYIKKAKGSAIGAAQVTGMGSSMTGQKTQDKAERKVQKRAAGINKAVDRLTKEDLEVDILDEAVESGNKGNGYHGQHDSEVADKKYSAMHAKVKKVAGEAGHLRDAKKPNVMVKHYLDSKHGRHLAGNEHDHEYIKKDFGRFKKAYKPELHEGVDFDEEGNLMAEKLKFSDFIAKINEQLLEYESDSSGVYRHTKKATYGTSYQGDDDEDDKPKKAEPAVKRGRGRPAGSYSGTYKARSAETKAAAAAKAAATKAANKNK
jgi:hypothetical protein